MKPERPRRPLPEALKEEIRLQVKLRWGSRSGTWTWGQRRRLGAGRTQTKGTSWEGVQGRRQRGAAPWAWGLGGPEGAISDPAAPCAWEADWPARLRACGEAGVIRALPRGTGCVTPGTEVDKSVTFCRRCPPSVKQCSKPFRVQGRVFAAHTGTGEKA